MIKTLSILGAGGHGRVIADIAEDIGWKVVFYDDRTDLNCIDSWHLKGSINDFFIRSNAADPVIVGLGNNYTRYSLHEQLKNMRANLVSVISRGAIVSKNASIFPGTVIMPGAIINIGAQIGEACILNTGSIVDHDCYLGHGVHISPGANLSGSVHVGNMTWIGTGSNIKHGIKIGDNVTVGAGSVIVKDVTSNQTMVGNPAKNLIYDKH